MKRNVKHLLLRKTSILKMHYFEEQEGTKYIHGNIYIRIIIFSYLSSTKPCLRFVLDYFAW